ncbi:NAD-dependent epimerase/dehydratase family protein [Xanthomonas euvesicatoria]|uniref:NAD-dependent epimerase/dehydratase family protein n=1 Tax=Xanthomonas euvesicatoria TaxID=456327 RepID=UPI001C43E5B2|nr:NAD(P)-dependent oxidoreductase [Xanthomonas euvesicatoria]MBV6885457.1 NAD(P)-dependent oxidoreductase [Xanthomonas campestris pv. euphorbiae]
MKIFIAGATGAVGLPLVRVLLSLGHEVTGLTRSGPSEDRLREVGALIAHANIFDRDAVRAAIACAAPDVVIDQLTSLPANPADIINSMPSDTRLHIEGGANLLAAAEEAGVSRFVMQSRGFYLDAPMGRLADESARLRVDAPGEVGRSAKSLQDYEDRLMASSILSGVVLRYGFFYGPGTWYGPNGAVAEQARARDMVVIGEGNAVWSFVHIDDAITATIAALSTHAGTYNVVDDNPLPVHEWAPAFCRWVGAPEPKTVGMEKALSAMGEEVVYYHHSLTGATNFSAKAALGFNPRPLLWKDA